MGKLKEMMIEANKAKEDHTIYDIAIVKSYAYTEEYNPTNGRTEPRKGAVYLKEGFVDGFMAGFTYKFTGD